MLDRDNPNIAWMKFNVSVLPYKANTSWVEEALFGIKECLVKKECPEHSEECKKHGVNSGWGTYIEEAAQAMGLIK